MSETTPRGSLTYAESGVDTAAGDRAVELMKQAVAATHGDHVVNGAGGFAGLFDVSWLKDYTRPLLASSTDGVGTKIVLARALDKHDTIGIDLVAMVVDDIVVCGAKPMVMTDYIACGKVIPERIADIVRGVATGCAEAGVALVGGETAEHPGVMAADDYDVAGAAVGVVEADNLLGAHRVTDGDAIVAMASSGVHSNGFSLVRRIADHAGWQWTQHVPELGGILAEQLLTPTRIYTTPCLDAAPVVHAYAHITGGGIAANIARVMPAGMVATIDRTSWAVPEVFGALGAAGGVDRAAMEETFNQGIGMVAVTAPEHVTAVVDACARHGIAAWQCGSVAAADQLPAGAVTGTKGIDGGAAVLVGDHQE